MKIATLIFFFAFILFICKLEADNNIKEEEKLNDSDLEMISKMDSFPLKRLKDMPRGDKKTNHDAKGMFEKFKNEFFGLNGCVVVSVNTFNNSCSMQMFDGEKLFDINISFFDCSLHAYYEFALRNEMTTSMRIDAPVIPAGISKEEKALGDFSMITTTPSKKPYRISFVRKTYNVCIYEKYGNPLENMNSYAKQIDDLLAGKTSFLPKNTTELVKLREEYLKWTAKQEEIAKTLKRKERLARYEKLRSEFLAGINDFLPYRWRWTKPENTYKHFIQTHFGDGELYSDAALAKNECIGKVPLMGIRKRFPVQESKNKVTEKDILSEFSNLKALVYKPFTTEHGFEFPRGFVNYCGIRDKNDIKKVHDYIIGVIYCDSKAQARDALIYMILNRPSVRDASPLVAETIRRDDLALGDIAFSCKGEILDDLTTKKDTNNSKIYFIRNNTAVIVKSMREDDSVLDTAKWIDEMLLK